MFSMVTHRVHKLHNKPGMLLPTIVFCHFLNLKEKGECENQTTSYLADNLSVTHHES